MNVEFYNSKDFKINSDDLKEKIFIECEMLLGMKLKRDYFPGAQPVTVERKNFETIKKEKYMICEKSDGERAVLILININDKPMCFIINRNNELYFMDFSFKKEVFEGSIFDGEIIKTKKTADSEGSWNYLIHDCMVYNGTSFMKISHCLRYACVVDFITKRYINKLTDCFNIKTKLFYNYSDLIAKTWEHICKNTENEIDGLIFTPINEPIKFGRQYSLLKWKEPGNHTMDLLVKKMYKKINLYGYKKSGNYIFKTFSVESTNGMELIKYCTTNRILDNLKEGIIIEFKYSFENDLFTPYRIRLDKIHPNGEITIINTLKNIEESIIISDFNQDPSDLFKKLSIK